MTDEQWYAMLDVHLTAPFRILRAAQPLICKLSKEEAEAGKEVFRKVVNISSVAGLGGNAGQVNYSAAKAGLVGLTMTLSKEWGRIKVNVKCVAFGLIKTRFTGATAAQSASIKVEGRESKAGVNPGLMEMMEKTISLGRAGTPDEAAGSVYLFCTPEADDIRDQAIVCGGGMSI